VIRREKRKKLRGNPDTAIVVLCKRRLGRKSRTPLRSSRAETQRFAVGLCRRLTLFIFVMSSNLTFLIVIGFQASVNLIMNII
jgi:hypothetical protein